MWFVGKKHGSKEGGKESKVEVKQFGQLVRWSVGKEKKSESAAEDGKLLSFSLGLVLLLPFYFPLVL